MTGVACMCHNNNCFFLSQLIQLLSTHAHTLSRPLEYSVLFALLRAGVFPPSAHQPPELTKVDAPVSVRV